ncbi:MAG: glycosyltransferase family 2 protein [Ignavibacteriales bacterium]|nr:glycosyltransferase family 2 protein [Ignavibacteriales bacterium]
MDVSVIIVNYISNELLEDCLNSLIKFTKEIEYEIIVVDNNSIVGKVEDVTSKYPNIILIKNQLNKGFSAANNQGIEIARGKYLLILNNDTIFIENTIKKVFDFVTSKNEKMIVGCKLLNQDKSWQNSFFDFPSPFNSFTSNFFLYKLFPKTKFNKYNQFNNGISEISEVDVVTGAFMLCPTDAIKKLKGFDERFFFYSEEIDLCYRFKKDFGKVYYFPVTSLIHIGGATVDKMQWFKYKNQAKVYIQFFQKHYKGMSLFFAILSHFIGLLLRILLSFFSGLITFRKSHLIKSYFYLRQMFIYPKNVF